LNDLTVQPLDVAVRIFFEKDGQKTNQVFLVRDMNEVNLMLSNLFLGAATEQVINEIGNPLCGAIVHGFQLNVANHNHTTEIFGGVQNEDNQGNTNENKRDNRKTKKVAIAVP